MTRHLLYLSILLPITMLISCRNGIVNNGNAGNLPAGTGNRYASHFSLTRYDHYTVLDIIDPWQGASGVRHRWYLVDKENGDGHITPEDGRVVVVPVKNIVCMSATHVAMISALGMAGTITGVSGIDLVYDPVVRELVDKGLVKEVGYEESINRELLVRLSPDLIISYGIGGESVAHYSKLDELGLRFLYNAEYLEQEPLGKAEWIMVFGALFCLGEKADSIFRASEAEYIKIRDEVTKKGGKRPAVLLGLPWRDSWFISPGNSYISRLIEDAGGEYLWKDVISELSMPMNLENVYTRAVTADYWLNPGTAESLAQISSTDPRLSSLKVFRRGNIYSNNGRVTISGANDYWELGSVRPGLILKDIASILDEELFTGDSLVFYRKLK
ncbi:MAG: ABC transporter substrate-binding protein [Bacteroidales bacterium]|jgi:iron complex transport system substrate-binding protein|nr:ABC transporter substrate-binding protein [Bacteroidales bacterium]